MPTVTIKTVKQGKHACGFCSTGNRHDLCPGGILNGNQTEILLCGCTQHPVVRRCIDCGARGDEVAESTWTCIDAEACQANREKHRREALGDFADFRTPEQTRKAEKVKERAAKAEKKASGSCLCCEEPTKGGLFLPGHDARYLARVTEMVKGGKYTVVEAQLLMSQQGISVALQEKLAKRVAS